MSLELLMTDDGSHTIYNSVLDETYHSKHGALTESLHVFIENGLKFWKDKHPKSKVKVFEMGLGTGLNVLLTVQFSIDNFIDISFHSIENNPLPKNILGQLNYQELFKKDESEKIFQLIHNGKWGEKYNLTANFEFCKHKKDIKSIDLKEKFDVFFFDAFAPSKQAEIWDHEVFSRMKQLMNPGSILVTYCSQGEFQRTLKSLNFELETLPGPPGKKEMIRATLF